MTKEQMRQEALFTLIRAALRQRKLARYVLHNEQPKDAVVYVAKALDDVVWHDLAALVEE